MGFSNLASSASQQVLATSFSWILVTFTWFSTGIQAAFRRSILSIRYCSASRGFSVPEKTIRWNLLKSETLHGLCSRGTVNNLWRRTSVFVVDFPSFPKYPHHVSIPFARIITRSARTITIFLSFHVRVGQKHDENEELEDKKIGGSQDSRMDYQEGIDNIVLAVGMYDHDSFVPAAN